MSKLPVALAAALLTSALPALANPVVAQAKPMMMVMRDSDGLVISVLDWMEAYPHILTTGGVRPGEVFYTFGGPVSTATGGFVALPVSGTPLPGQPVFLGGPELLTAGAEGPVLDIGGVAYQVEAEGVQIWLRDLATGTRHAAARHVAPVAPDAQGLSVNPAQLVLD
jgi:hypothetical protein